MVLLIAISMGTLVGCISQFIHYENTSAKYENNLTILDDYKEKSVLIYFYTGNKNEKAV